jgi:transposase-like protein
VIIDWTLHSFHYERAVKSQKKIFYKCPICKRNNLARHGYYKRNIVRWQGTLEEVQLKILRVRCLACKVTHAVLPKDVAPYRIYSISFYLKILRLLFQFKGKVSCCQRILKIYHNFVYRTLHGIHLILYIFRKQWISWLYYLQSTKIITRKKVRQILFYTT